MAPKRNTKALYQASLSTNVPILFTEPGLFAHSGVQLAKLSVATQSISLKTLNFVDGDFLSGERRSLELPGTIVPGGYTNNNNDFITVSNKNLAEGISHC